MNGPLLRLLDANANRAREALRVVEDYARFVRDDANLSAALKGIRHDLTAAMGPFVADAILFRDTPGDVGTKNKTAGESARQDLCDVVTAAGKRLGEALRAIEEVLKSISASDASTVESLRYRFYDVERDIALTLRPAACDFSRVRLYVLVTETLCRIPWLQAAEQAIEGGADCLQLREKELEGGELLRRAVQIVELCRDHHIPCVINDRPDVALLARAHGVHVGQGDLPARRVRQLLGRDMIVGVSTHTVAQARQAVLDGADYVGVGPVFRSRTKPRDFLPGLGLAREVVRSIPQVPAVAIAGIDAGNVDEVLASGVRAVAVSSAVLGATDVRAAAAQLKRKFAGAATQGTQALSQDTDVRSSASLVD